MNVAVPLFGQYVSPRLGSISRLLIARTNEGRVQHSQILEIEDLSAANLPDWLMAMRVGTLICGGIAHCDRQALESHGIEVIWGVIGLADTAVSALAAGALHNDQFVSATQCAHEGKERSSGKPRVPRE
ncbi:MAG: hypothetical protein AMXMBFR13_48640 [Phycisphaerae bacterium]